MLHGNLEGKITFNSTGVFQKLLDRTWGKWLRLRLCLLEPGFQDLCSIMCPVTMWSKPIRCSPRLLAGQPLQGRSPAGRRRAGFRALRAAPQAPQASEQAYTILVMLYNIISCDCLCQGPRAKGSGTVAGRPGGGSPLSPCGTDSLSP